jgi:hypothetical protein
MTFAIARPLNYAPMIDYIASAPRLRLGITLALTIAIGVLSSIFASQIMPGGVLTWSLTSTVSSFWLLLCIGAILVYLNVAFLNHDQSVQKFADDEHCLAFIRKAQLEGLAEKIRKNPQDVELIDAKKFLKSLNVKAT